MRYPVYGLKNFSKNFLSPMNNFFDFSLYSYTNLFPIIKIIMFTYYRLILYHRKYGKPKILLIQFGLMTLIHKVRLSHSSRDTIYSKTNSISYFNKLVFPEATTTQTQQSMTCTEEYSAFENNERLAVVIFNCVFQIFRI